MRQSIADLSLHSQTVMKEVLGFILSPSGPAGGIRFDLADERFDVQPMVQMLPKLLVVPFEVLISICTAGMSDGNRDTAAGMLAEAYCSRIENFISQV